MSNKKYELRKAIYEKEKLAHEKVLEAKRELYERRKAIARVGIGIRGITISPRVRYAPRLVAGKIIPEVIKPEVEEKPPLVDVIDENEHLRIDIQLSDISLPRSITVDEITDLSFRHGVLEIRLRKRKEKLTKEEKEKIAEVEKGEITAEVKKKVLLMLKKRKKEEIEKFMI
ncbi:MAG: hypothetical protein AB1485_00450 [Candidatus Thermoplasmatota archaeon]